MRLTRFYLWASIVTAGLLAVITAALLLMAMAGGFGPGEWAIIAALFVLAAFLYSIAGLGCAIPHDRGRHPRLMRSGMVMGALAAAGWCITPFLWSSSDLFDWPRALAWPTVWTGCIVLLGMLSLIRARATWWARLRRTTLVGIFVLGAYIALGVTLAPMYAYEGFGQGDLLIVLVVALGSYPLAALCAIAVVAVFMLPRQERTSALVGRVAVLALLAGGAVAFVIMAVVRQSSTFEDRLTPHTYDVPVYSFYYGSDAISIIPGLERWEYEELVGRVGVLIGIAAASMFVVTVISAFFQPPAPPEDAPDSERLPYWLTCPRCGVEQDARTGAHLCSSCGLRVVIEVIA